MGDVLRLIGSSAVLLIDIVIFMKNIKTPANELKHTFIMLQLVFGAILFCTGHGLGALLLRILLALVCFIFSGGLVKIAWGFSVISGIFSIVRTIGLIIALIGGVK